MVRSFFITCLFAFMAFLSTPHSAHAQTSNLSQETAAEEEFTLHSEDEIEKAYRAVKRNEAYQ